MQNAKCKMQNGKNHNQINTNCKLQNGTEEIAQRGKGLKKDLSERLENFAVEIVKLVGKLGKSFVGRHVAGELLSSSTSAGANYEEAYGAESRSDFVHKL